MPVESGAEQMCVPCKLTLDGIVKCSDRHLNRKMSMEQCIVPRKQKLSQLCREALVLLQSERPKEIGLVLVKYIVFE